ncbi:putative endopeptidase p60 precursor [Poriferisphaera corsica]|uniref:Putative endopeptidase p60 n=1 Tax=Poriferisphaera corsica TaxID=2528020 RepID=A0A517YUI3_9BACT|nr:LysM domain-containing protein [Poriferisphaera corsica]QDU33899.1 putative endopeptidase p60 precursor [Poriferisphaera corsica]
MKFHWALITTAIAATTIGCNTNPPQVAQAPPPPPTIQPETEIIVPVQVEEPAASANSKLEVEFTQTAPTPAQSFVEPAPQPEPARRPSTYVIKKGDTLWSIANKHYGNGLKWVDIMDANPGLKEKRMYVGKEIRLP